VIAQHLEQCLLRRERDLVLLAVDLQPELHVPLHCLDPKQIYRPHFTPKPWWRKGPFRGYIFPPSPLQGDRPWPCASATKPPISPPRPPKGRSTSTSGSATSGRSCFPIPRTPPPCARPSSAT